MVVLECALALEFVDRNIIFEKNQYLARFLYDWQQSLFDPSQNAYEAGEEVWLDMDAEAPDVLTEEQARDLNLEHENYCRAMKDPFEVPPPVFQRAECCIAELGAESFEQFVGLIGPAFEKLSVAMEWEELLFITAYRDAYLAQQNDYPPAERAADTLKKLGFGADYSGGVISKRNENSKVLGPLFTLQRYNASAPYVNLAAAGSSVVGMLCKYGNIHFEGYDRDEFTHFKVVLEDCGFRVPEDGICEEKFSQNDLTEGRRIVLD